MKKKEETNLSIEVLKANNIDVKLNQNDIIDLMAFERTKSFQEDADELIKRSISLKERIKEYFEKEVYEVYKLSPYFIKDSKIHFNFLYAFRFISEIYEASNVFNYMYDSIPYNYQNIIHISYKVNDLEFCSSNFKLETIVNLSKELKDELDKLKQDHLDFIRFYSTGDNIYSEAAYKRVLKAEMSKVLLESLPTSVKSSMNKKLNLRLK